MMKKEESRRSRNDEIQEIRNRYISSGMASVADFYVESARGAIVKDVEGREYIDFAGGIAVMNVGHSHPKVVSAIREQAEKFTHTCFMVLPYEPAVELAEKLSESLPGDTPKSTMFVNSGAEAVENAVKIARTYTGRQAVIAFEGGFHGRTLLGMTLTSKVKPYKYGFGPFAPEVYRMPYAYCYRCPFKLRHPECNLACAEHLNDFLISHVAGDKVAALVVEPVLGEGGFVVPPDGYLNRLKEICDEHGILFIADEVQTGIGRTAEMFAMSHWGIEADLTTVAKSLAAGMPLSAVVGKKEIMDSVHPGGIGGTYGGNPVACSAALAVFNIFEEENLLDKAQKLGSILEKRFNSFKDRFNLVGDARGLGAMRAFELVKNRETKEPAADKAKELVRYCFSRGLILLSCGTYGNVIRVLMPLVIEDEDLEKGLGIIEDGLKEISAPDG